MKILTIIWFLTVLLCAALILAQGFSEKERPAKRTPLLPSGRVQEAWVKHYTGPDSSSEATALVNDISGNVYVTGRSKGVGTGCDYATVKYNSAGLEQWAVRYNGPGNADDWARALAVDDSGNVYVTGRSMGSGTGKEYATVKYSAEGVQQWVAYYRWGWARALAVDDSGNVYVTGHCLGISPVSRGCYATIKYNPAGVQQWVSLYCGPKLGYDEAIALAVDSFGNVHVVGLSVGSGTSFDYATVKYNSAGVYQWVARYNGPGNGYDVATALAVDATGNVYVTGWSIGSGTSGDYATIQYYRSGIQRWVARYNGPSNGFDEASALAVDASGNVYVTGRSWGSGTDYDYATVKYNSSGIQQWVARYNGPGDSTDVATALAIDSSGNIYVTGSSWGTSFDWATVKYNSDGLQEWVVRYDGPGNSIDRANALAVDDSGDVYVTGSSEGKSWSIYTTIKYVQTPVYVEDKKRLTPNRYWLVQNYPNPFNSSTTIRFGIQKSSCVTLKVFNLLGQEVTTLVNEKKPAGEYEVRWNPTNLASGIYVYRLQAGGPSAGSVLGFVETKKLILLR